MAAISMDELGRAEGRLDGTALARVLGQLGFEDSPRRVFLGQAHLDALGALADALDGLKANYFFSAWTTTLKRVGATVISDCPLPRVAGLDPVEVEGGAVTAAAVHDSFVVAFGHAGNPSAPFLFGGSWATRAQQALGG